MSILQLTSLGNDIIDLSDPDTVPLSRNPKFINRVYSPTELEDIDKYAGRNKDLHLWKLWAAKEAAYKAVKRCDHDIIFSPSKFIFHETTSSVTFRDYDISIKFRETESYIHASAYLNSGNLQDNIVLEIEGFRQIEPLLESENRVASKSYSRESSLCRGFAILQLRKYYKTDAIEIRKETGRQGVPEIFRDGRSTGDLISLSHHGRFCAVLFCPLTK